jgi:hypothetical protein
MGKRAIQTDIVLIDIIDFSRLGMDMQLEIISHLSHLQKNDSKNAQSIRYFDGAHASRNNPYG